MNLSISFIDHQAERELRHLKNVVKAAVFVIVALIIVFVVVARARAETLIGEASYYTYESCKKEGASGIFTASGERFNENDYTAALWNCPFGAIYRVTNLLTGAWVEIRINDRGPSKRLVKKGRIIDLSKKAMQTLCGVDGLKQGIIKVKIERIK